MILFVINYHLQSSTKNKRDVARTELQRSKDDDVNYAALNISCAERYSRFSQSHAFDGVLCPANSFDRHDRRAQYGLQLN